MKLPDTKSKSSRRVKPAARHNHGQEVDKRAFATQPKKNPLMTRSSNDDVDRILTVPMLAEYLLCHPSTIYRLLKNNRIPGFRIGSDWRFRRSLIDEWLNKATISASN